MLSSVTTQLGIFSNLLDVMSSIFSANPSIGVRFLGSGMDQNVFGGRDYKHGMQVVDINVKEMTEFMNQLKDLDETPNYSEYDPDLLIKKYPGLKEKLENIAKGIEKSDEAIDELNEMVKENAMRIHNLDQGFIVQGVEMDSAGKTSGLWSDTIPTKTGREPTTGWRYSSKRTLFYPRDSSMINWYKKLRK